MKFEFKNEGSRGEFDITFGGIEKVNELVNSYIEKRESLKFEGMDDEYVNEFMDMEFGGITEECFVEISMGEEESWIVREVK
tara:strand:+ start:148 stop:393 length:246 start_codon:yes stop_codon:yes gene_type:complete